MSITKEYKEQMTVKHEVNWGHTAVRFGAGRDVVKLLDNDKLAITTVLDFGAGTGSLGVHIQEERPGRAIWTQYDPGMKGMDCLPDGPFDLVVTCDVLEHVEPHLLDQTIFECSDRADRVVYHNIPCYPTGSTFSEGPYKGQNLHLTVEQPKFWEDKVRRNQPDFTIAEVVIVKRHNSADGYRIRVMITSERIRPRVRR